MDQSLLKKYHQVSLNTINEFLIEQTPNAVNAKFSNSQAHSSVYGAMPKTNNEAKK